MTILIDLCRTKKNMFIKTEPSTIKYKIATVLLFNNKKPKII